MDIRTLIQEYDAALDDLAKRRLAATREELSRVEWVDRQIVALMEQGKKATPAKEEAHRDSRHRAQQDTVAVAIARVDDTDRRVRVLEFQIKLALSERREVSA